jgi:APA family basic amino acid/polyamine antiporter
VPLQEIATAPADRIGVVVSQYIFWCYRNVDYCRNDYDFNFACNNGLIMTGARILHYGSRRCILQAAELNKCSVPEWSIQAVFWASVLCLTGKYGDLLDFVVIIVLIFYILRF